MMWNKQNIFEPSGCLSREVFTAFLKDELPTDIKAVANEHIASCPFCSDALEGFKNIIPAQDLAKVVTSIDISFKERLKTQNKKTNKRTIVWISFSAAATTLLLLGLFSIFRNNSPQTQLAENMLHVKDTVRPSQSLAEKMVEPKASPSQIVSGVQTKLDKKNVVNTGNTKETSDIRPADEIAANAPIETDQTEKKETKKEEVPVIAGTSVEMADTSSVTQNNISMKSVTYTSSAAYSKRKAVPTSVVQHPPTYEREDIALAQGEVTKNKKDAAFEQERVFVIVEEQATFQGGDINKFREYVLQQFRFSKSLLDSSISGKIIIQFVVDERGKVIDIKILQSILPDIDNKIIRILKNSPLWIPGKQQGKPVKEQFVLPINVLIK